MELALSDNPLGNEVAVNLAAVLSQVQRAEPIPFCLFPSRYSFLFPHMRLGWVL